MSDHTSKRATEFEPGAANQGNSGQNVAWFDASPKSIDPSTRQLLETYSHIPAEKVEQHIIDVRDRAFEIYQYPCLGQFRFLDLSIGKSEQYGEVLQRVKDGQTLLDLGCCLGQDLRRLLADGAPSQNLIGVDLEPGFHERGFELFGDKDAFRGTLLGADMSQDPAAADSPLRRFAGAVDMIHASSFYHLFSWEMQKTMARHSVALLRRRPGSLVFGRQVGNEKAQEKPRMISGGSVWRHDAESWKRMWTEVGDEVGVNFDVTVELTDVAGWTDPSARKQWDNQDGTKRLRYAVRML